jgi:serine/threonine-protein phosphatase 2A regulatory subunit B
MTSTEPLDWKFCQVFGDRSAIEEVSDVDIVSAVEFNETGEYIATGDRGGRVVIFERSQDKEAAKAKKKEQKTPEYKFFVEFQSHEPEFDYLKSLEIEEKINKIKWLNRNSNGHFLLTTNDKTIKLWRVYEKKVKQVLQTNVANGVTSNIRAPPPIQQLKVPKVQVKDSIITATGRRVYANAHAYHINSISVNSDGETYISSDDLRINLWNLAVSDQSFSILYSPNTTHLSSPNDTSRDEVFPLSIHYI